MKNENQVENENSRIELNPLEKTVQNHPILSSTVAGIVSSGVLGLTELGVKSAIDYFAGTDYKHSPVFSPWVEVLLGLSIGSFGLGSRPCGRDFHEDKNTEYQFKLVCGLTIGSAVVAAGINKLVHGGYGIL